MTTVLDQIIINSKKFPNKIALTDGKNSISYSEFFKDIVAYSETLKSFGLKKNSVVILSAIKSIDFVVTYFACQLVGITSVPLAVDVNEQYFKNVVSQTCPNLIISVIYAKELEIYRDYKSISEVKSTLSNSTYLTDYYYLHNQALENKACVSEIIFTSGTTGIPKGVVLTQENVSASAYNINEFINNTSDDVEIIALPFSHSFGLGRLRCCLSNAQTVVLVNGFFNLKKFYRLANEFSVSGIAFVPASYAVLKKLGGDQFFSLSNQLKYIEIGSSSMPRSDKLELLNNFPNTRICMHYGCTEASRSTFLEFHDIDHLDTIGKNSPNTDVKVFVNTSRTNALSDYHEANVNEVGELCVSSMSVTNGYLHSIYSKIQGNNKYYHGNFFRTGDLGYKTNDGYFVLKGRSNDLINVGGEKVYPTEVENVILKYPGNIIVDCACVGVEDPDFLLGNVVKAFVVVSSVKDIEKEKNQFFENLKQFLSKQLENFKVPRVYEIIDSLPKTQSGKIKRNLLK